MVTGRATTLYGVDDHPLGIFCGVGVSAEGELAAATTMNSLSLEGGLESLANRDDCGCSVDDVTGPGGDLAWEVITCARNRVSRTVSNKLERLGILKDNVSKGRRCQHRSEKENLVHLGKCRGLSVRERNCERKDSVPRKEWLDRWKNRYMRKKRKDRGVEENACVQCAMVRSDSGKKALDICIRNIYRAGP